MESLPITIQFISIVGALMFMIMIFRLIIKGHLREEYSVVWIVCTGFLLVFSFWRSGLEKISLLLGVYYPPSLIFLVGILAIIVFLVHLSVVISRQQNQIKNLTHELAYLRQELDQRQSVNLSKPEPTQPMTTVSPIPPSL
ncbi:DUF2304 family protein [Rudanella paleaurantiibacter]|uniref:DUF2304 family protein n=1 Tax=Rudanella paleaurantiibacter TaxID=2614655 RepID=A0A7J5U3H3_9BACT|nr:DUF2304 domain-containing protein [Rudanella paleaurantiibacter]KAB7732042.1 DUF2304 family protein [Rudanella paleaurantiibacter]